MTPFEAMFVRVIEFYEKRNIPVFLHGSTLLRVIRNDGAIDPREDVLTDKEINLGIRAENFTDNLYKDIKEEYPYFNAINGRLPNNLIFYGERNSISEDQWALEPGFVLLARYWSGKEKRIEYMGDNHCLQFPRKFFDKLDKVEVLGKKVFVPKDPEEYLTYYFGEDWREENKGWHWSEAKAYTTWEELKKGGEL